MRGRALRILIFTLLFLVFYAVYTYYTAVSDHGRLAKRVDLLFEHPEATTIHHILAEFQKSADELGISIPPQEIHLTLEDTEEDSLVGKRLRPSGLQIKSKVLTLNTTYTRDILWFSKQFSLHRRKVFTYRAEMPSRAHELFLTD